MLTKTKGPANSGARIERFSGETMGTQYLVQVVIGEGCDISALGTAIDDSVSLVDAQMSTFKPTSDLCRFNKAAVGEWVQVPEQLHYVFVAAIALGNQSDGAFDVTVFEAVERWGFGPSERGLISELLAQPIVAPAASYQDIELRQTPYSLRKNKPLTADLSAIAKGYGVDEIARVLRTFRVENYLVEIAGEILAKGTKPGGIPWIVGIELPVPERRVVYKNVCLHNCALASSGYYRNFLTYEGKKYCHAIDPLTGRPVDNELLAVSVLMPSCMDADAMATALMVMGRQRAVEFANQNELAALFIVAAEGGFTEIMTERFGALSNADG